MWWRNFQTLPDRENAPSIFVEVTVILFLLIFLYGLTRDPTSFSDNSQPRFYLTTLAGAQASILAIVFSITFLGIQLVANKYTLRVADLFVNDNLFHTTLITFFISIALDLYLIISLDNEIGRLYMAGLSISTGLAILAILFLYLTIKRVTRWSNPNGLAKVISQRTDVDKNVEAFVKEDKQEHPSDRLYSLVVSSIYTDDRMASKGVFEQYLLLVTSIIRSVNDVDNISVEPDHQILTQIFEEQFPEIVSAAYQEQRDVLLRETMSCLRQLGEEQLSRGNPEIALLAFNGLRNIQENNQAREKSQNLYSILHRQHYSIINSAVQSEEVDVATEMLTALETDFEETAETSPASNVISEICSIHFEEAPKILATMMITFGTEIKSTTFRRDPETSVVRQGKTACLHQWQRLLMTTTLTTFDISQLRNELLTEVLSCWRISSTRICRLPARSYSIQFYKSMLEMALIHMLSKNDGDVKESWVKTFAQIRKSGGSSLLDEAGESLIHSIAGRGSIGYSPVNKVETSLESVSRQISTSSRKSEDTIEAILEGSREEVTKLLWEEYGIQEIRDFAAANPNSINVDARLHPYNISKYGEDGLLHGSKDGIGYFKFIQSIAPADASKLKRLKKGVIGRTHNRDSSLYVVLPSISKETKHALDIVNVDYIEFSPPRTEDDQQTRLSDFVLPDLASYDSEILGE